MKKFSLELHPSEGDFNHIDSHGVRRSKFGGAAIKHITNTRLKIGLFLLLGFLTGLLFMPIQATAQYSQLVVFGDSLSDTGRLYDATGGTIPPAPPYDMGRFTNGRVWVDYVAEALGLSATSFADGGTNFAIGGALTDRANEFDEDPACTVHMDVCSSGLLDQIDTYVRTLGGGYADPDALYVVWAGANDFRAYPSSETISSAVTNVVTAIATLTSLGARTIIAPTQPPLGLIPSVLALNNPVASARLSALTAAYDGALTAGLNSNGLNVIRVDIFKLLWEVAGNPERFGFTNVTDPCLDPSTFTVCPNPDQYEFWDQIHPTTAAHAIIAHRILQEIEQSD